VKDSRREREGGVGCSGEKKREERTQEELNQTETLGHFQSMSMGLLFGLWEFATLPNDTDN